MLFISSGFILALTLTVAPGPQSAFQSEFDNIETNPPRDAPPMTGTQIAMAREVGGWPLYTIVMGLGQMLSATSFQITLLSGRNWQDDIQLYVLGAIFLAASATWYPLFRLKPSVYVLSAPWIFFGLAFFLIGLPSISEALHPAQRAIASAATWSYAIASAAAFLFFGLNFGEEAVRLPKKII